MALHPVVRLGLWLAQRVRMPAMTSLEDYRDWDARSYRVIHRLMARPPRPARLLARRIPVPGGEILLRIYLPPGTGPFPAHVFAHGGAFWMGSIEDTDPLCRWYCAHARCVIVSVAYRLAPEHPYPTPAEDVYAAFQWTREHAAELGADPERVSIGGVSAGAGLAAAATLMARDRGTPLPLSQVLEIPFLDTTLRTAADTGVGLSTVYLREAADLYTGGGEHALADYASPGLAADLAGLPPTLVLTCEYDTLRGSGTAYVERLRAAGVAVDWFDLPGHIHGSSYLTRLLPSSRRYVDTVVHWLRTRR
ncbi:MULTISPECIES: alpha/beta hydrolase [unclassified Crossiella]|uniref:alpha/beta hydrolase n=1 Tax=unclassified Crossiella TaxID=2620835 RepID=UPI001FFF1CD4|nr:MULTISPECIES: alpha/beta hydrolase [unclassified Crossiella]MCK2242845.1 alpha/beta hydrolase [Crossiella sp. S99.2]MCK2256722.1 alpha/beta hydrolase [Crossiella sp. S99.1]